MSVRLPAGGCARGAVARRPAGPRPSSVAPEACRRTSGHLLAITSARREAVTIAGDARYYRASVAARHGSALRLSWGDRWATISANLHGERVAMCDFCAKKGDAYKVPDGVLQAPEALRG